MALRRERGEVIAQAGLTSMTQDQYLTCQYIFLLQRQVFSLVAVIGNSRTSISHLTGSIFRPSRLDSARELMVQLAYLKIDCVRGLVSKSQDDFDHHAGSQFLIEFHQHQMG